MAMAMKPMIPTDEPGWGRLHRILKSEDGMDGMDGSLLRRKDCTVVTEALDCGAESRGKGHRVRLGNMQFQLHQTLQILSGLADRAFPAKLLTVNVVTIFGEQDNSTTAARS
jgi:hypothetical protein